MQAAPEALSPAPQPVEAEWLEPDLLLAATASPLPEQIEKAFAIGNSPYAV